MTEEESGEDDDLIVDLGEAPSVEGAPLSRVVSRLTWPQEKTEIVRKEGDILIRTPTGPQELSSLLEDVEITYFARRQEFLSAINEVTGTGPFPTKK